MSLPSMRIIYFTSQGAGVTNGVLGLLKQYGQRVPLVVTTQGPAARRTESYKDVIADLPIGQDLLVTNHMRRLGTINTHPSLLPRYRGPNPLFRHFMNGETKGGLTVHRMDAGFDTGPILAQRAVEITPDDDIDSSVPKHIGAAAGIIGEMLEKVVVPVSSASLRNRRRQRLARCWRNPRPACWCARVKMDCCSKTTKRRRYSSGHFSLLEHAASHRAHRAPGISRSQPDTAPIPRTFHVVGRQLLSAGA